MFDTKIYDFDLNLLTVSSGATTANGFLYFNDIGTLELHFPLTDKICDIVLDNKYLIISNKYFTGVITGIQIKAEFIIYARSLNWLLSKKVTPFFEAENKNIFEIIKSKILEVYSQIENIEVKTSDEFSDIDYKTEQYTATFDTIKELLGKDNAGHNFYIDFSNKKYIFECFKRKENSIVLSESFRNAYDMAFDTDILNLFQNGYYQQNFQNMGDWNADTNEPTLRDLQKLNYEKFYKVTVAGTRFDINFSENDYIVCESENGKWEKATEQPENGKWKKITTETDLPQILTFESVLSGNIKQDAEKDLKEKAEVKSMSASSILKYNKDYLLGDIIKVQMKKGDFAFTKKAVINGVNFYFDGTKNGEKPILEYLEE